MKSNQIYAEIGSTLRNYSNLILSIRLGVVAQGLIILGAVGTLVTKLEFALAFYTSFFGLVLSFVLLRLHNVYLNHFNNLLKYAIDLEGKLKKDRLGSLPMPWEQYSLGRKQHRAYFYITFILFIVIFFITSIYALVNLRLGQA